MKGSFCRDHKRGSKSQHAEKAGVLKTTCLVRIILFNIKCLKIRRTDWAPCAGRRGEILAASSILPPPFLDGCQIYGGWFGICGACLPHLIVEEAERFRLCTLLVKS